MLFKKQYLFVAICRSATNQLLPLIALKPNSKGSDGQHRKKVFFED
jgi:hypothetical protein